MNKMTSHDQRHIENRIGLALGLCLVYAMNELAALNTPKKHSFGLSAGRRESPWGTPPSRKTLTRKSLGGGKKVW